MKKFLCLMFCTFLAIQVYAGENFCGIGAYIEKDRNKFFVLHVPPNTPAQKAGLPAGSEILKINETKVKSKSIDEVLNLIKGEKDTDVTLLVKNGREKVNYTIKRQPIIIPEVKESKTFSMHWAQIVPKGFENAEPFYISLRYSPELQERIEINNYWAFRKRQFKDSFDVCESYSGSNRETCYINLVNREIAKTNADEQRMREEEYIRLQAAQNTFQAINRINTNINLQNINNSIQQNNFYLQQQNMQLWNINNSLMRY